MRWETFLIVYRNFIQDNKYKLNQNRPGFVDDVTKAFGVFLVRNSNRCSLTKREG